MHRVWRRRQAWSTTDRRRLTSATIARATSPHRAGSPKTKDMSTRRHRFCLISGATPQAMIDLFQKHVNAELAGDLDTTMATMSEDPHLNHVPTMAGGVGRDGVRA